MNRTDELSKKRRSLRAKRHIRLLFISVTVLVMIASAIWLIVLILTGDREAPRLAFLSKSEMAIKEDVSLIFIDDAVTVTAPDHGIFLPVIEEGERVAKDALLGFILPYDREQDALYYRDLEQRIRARAFVLSGFADTLRNPQPLTPIDSRLRASIVGLTRLGTENRAEAVSEFRHYLAAAKSQAPLFASSDDLLSSLRSEQERLKEDFSSDGRVVTLRAHMTGELSFYPFSALREFDPVWGEYQGAPEQVIERLNKLPVNGRDLRYERVRAGEQVLSMRRFSGRSMVLWRPKTDIENIELKQGSRVELLFRGGFQLKNIEVLRVREELEGDWLWLSSDAWTGYVPSVAAIRDVELVVSRVKGLSVPLRSLFDVNLEEQTAKLRKIRSAVTETVAVRILAEDGHNALIATLSEEEKALTETDLYVTNPWTAGDGVLID